MTASLLSEMASAAAAALVDAGTSGPLVLQLVKVPSAAIVGIYKGVMPERALHVHPSVYDDLMAVAPRVVFSDIFRSPESSLRAMQEKTGVQPPSYSHHNFGGAVDLDTKASMKRGGFASKWDLDAFMDAHFFRPFNVQNGVGTREQWHYSHGRGFVWVKSTETNTAPMAERWIQHLYGAQMFGGTYRTTQAALARLGYYHGAIDGKWGPQSRSACGMFQRALKVSSWARKKGLATFVEGEPDKVTRRVLAYCACVRNVVSRG